MKLYIDTKAPETISLRMTGEERSDMFEGMSELSFGIAALIIDFINQRARSDDYQKMQEVILELVPQYIERLLDECVSEQEDSQDIGGDVAHLREQMEQSGEFSEEEIDAIVKLVIDSGGLESALEYLKSIDGKDN